MVWNHSVATKTACVRTAHTLHLNLKVCVARSGRVCGVATHAVGGNAGYGLLLYTIQPSVPLISKGIESCTKLTVALVKKLGFILKN